MNPHSLLLNIMIVITAGLALLFSALLAYQYWDTRTRALLLITIAGLALFILYERPRHD
jgi:hypothetical protein